MDNTEQPKVILPEFKLVEKKNLVRTYLPSVAITVSSLTAIVAATYLAAKTGARAGVSGMSVLVTLSEELQEKAKELNDSATNSTE